MVAARIRGACLALLGGIGVSSTIARCFAATPAAPRGGFAVVSPPRGPQRAANGASEPVFQGGSATSGGALCGAAAAVVAVGVLASSAERRRSRPAVTACGAFGFGSSSSGFMGESTATSYAAYQSCVEEPELEAPRHDVSALTTVVMRGKAWWIKSTGRDGTRGKVFDWPRREARRRGEELFRHDVDNFEFMCHNVINFPGSMKKKIMRGRTKYGGYGRTCGYGQKGAGTRGRRTINPGYEGGGVPIHHRTPRLTQEQLNSMKPDTHMQIPLRVLNRCNDGEEVDYEELMIRGFAVSKRKQGQRLVRVKGTPSDRFEVKNLTVYAHAFEPAAREKIEANGGRCIRLHEIANIPIEAEFVRMDMQAMAAASEEPGDGAGEEDAIPEE